MMAPEVAIVVVNYGTPGLLLNLLESVGRSPDLNLIREVIIVDNGYPERGDSRTAVAPANHPFPILFAQNREHSYASGVNRGAALASGDALVISNTDVELLPGFPVQPLVSAVLDPDSKIGIAAPQLVYPDGSWQPSARRFPSIGEAVLAVLTLDTIWHGLLTWLLERKARGDGTRDVNYVDGAFMVVDPDCFRATGGFDSTYRFYGEDADFCWRAAEAGWRTAFVPSTRVMHVRGASSETHDLRDATVRLLQAKQRFVRDRWSQRRAAWYGRLYRLAVWERALLYGLIARIFPRERWRKRADRASARWQALKDWQQDEGFGEDKG